MAVPKQYGKQDVNSDLPDDESDHPPTLPPRKPLETQQVSEEQNQNGKSYLRLHETGNPMAFSNDNEEDNYELAANLDVCNGNSFDNIVSECPLLNLSGNYETDKTRKEIHSGLKTNMSDSLDKYFTDDLFRQSSDLDSEIGPILYTPDFSACSRGIDAVQSEISFDLPTPKEERLQNENDSLDVLDSTESIMHLKHPPSFSSKLIPMDNRSDSGSSKTSPVCLDSYFRQNSIYSLDMKPTFAEENVQGSDTESEEHYDNADRLKSRQQAVYLEKLRELEKEVNQLQQLQKDGISSGLSNIQNRRLSSQRSVSDSNIYNSMEFEDIMKGLSNTTQLSKNTRDNYDITRTRSTENVNSRTRKNRSSTTNYDQADMRTCSSFENLKSKATMLLGKIIKRDKSTNGGTSQNISVKVEDRVELSCPCGRSCKHVKSLVTVQGGLMWASFKQCSWVSLYNNSHEKVHTFDTRGCVDSMAVSVTGVLYISCPPQKRIIMLSTNLEMTVLRSFSRLYPRGVAVSPHDGAVVVCMTSQAVGNVMNGPSKNSCLMRFKGETPNGKGTILNKGNHFGYPVKVTINTNGFLLVSDFGLKCLFVLDKGGNMLRTFSSLGGRPLWLVHTPTSNNTDNSFYVIQGGAGTLSITLLAEFLGTFEEKSTSTKDEPFIKQNVETASMNTEGKMFLASGIFITRVSLMNK